MRAFESGDRKKERFSFHPLPVLRRRLPVPLSVHENGFSPEVVFPWTEKGVSEAAVDAQGGQGVKRCVSLPARARFEFEGLAVLHFAPREMDKGSAMPGRPVYFSRHAFDRLGERTQLTARDVHEIFAKRKYVNMGGKPGVMKDHLLFFSVQDKACFVAIQDAINGEVVTVLPPEYHANLAWPIPAEAEAEAMRLAYRREPAAASTVFKVRVRYFNEDGAPKARTLPSIASAPYGNDIGRLLAEHDLSGIVKAARKKGVTVDDRTTFVFRYGKRGVDVEVGAREMETANRRGGKHG